MSKRLQARLLPLRHVSRDQDVAQWADWWLSGGGSGGDAPSPGSEGGVLGRHLLPLLLAVHPGKGACGDKGMTSAADVTAVIDVCFEELTR